MIWTVAFAIEMGLVMSPLPVFKTVVGLGIIMVIVLPVAAYIFVALNETGWESNRTLCIGIGGGLGWFMMLNVWGIVWRTRRSFAGCRGPCWHSYAAGSSETCTCGTAGITSEFLPVLPDALLYGRSQPLSIPGLGDRPCLLG